MQKITKLAPAAQPFWSPRLGSRASQFLLFGVVSTGSSFLLDFRETHTNRGINGFRPSGYSQTQTLIVKYRPRPRPRPSGYKIYGPRPDPLGSRGQPKPDTTVPQGVTNVASSPPHFEVDYVFSLGGFVIDVGSPLAEFGGAPIGQSQQSKNRLPRHLQPRSPLVLQLPRPAHHFLVESPDATSFHCHPTNSSFILWWTA
ncbi:hypothetical protein M9H77_21958 [Catharanthus roseus]|uniref:Uncharacterized protein n=1 Tax=Catharanthus roseus TaxID=4058 RepID=A0ACC0AP43_CATRO|nr:hypothetical protein M9H77_21958 [Catharanthus roseus]